MERCAVLVPQVSSPPLAEPGWIEAVPAYDAFLLLSFGGPEGPDDVLPFLRNVTRGRGVPEARLEEVAEHYIAFGGVSPLNAACCELLAAGGAHLPPPRLRPRLARGHPQ